MDEYQRYLKNALAVEKTVVSYRLLSRALKVHVNQAKEMLYDFYTSENTCKSKSVHATYIVTGYRKPPPSAGAGEVGNSSDDDDTMMFDSSLPGTQAPVTEEEGKKAGLVKVVELCQEEELDVVKAEFEKVLSVHLYSIEQMPLKDFSILTGCCVELLSIHQKEDPLKMGATYGTITNPSATRTGSRAPPPPEQRLETMSVGQDMRKETALVKKETVAKETKSEKKDEPEIKAEAREKKPATKASALPAKKTAPATAKLKRGQSNDFFNSWKTVPKKATAGSVSELSSAAPSPNVEEEPIMKMDSSDDDDEDNDEPSPPAHDNAENARKRKEKEEELKNMMDDEGEGEGEDEEGDEDEEGEEDIEMQDDEPPEKVANIRDSPEPEQPSGTVTGVRTGGGRVRGRRKVSKKVQSRDEEGYLVTKMEYVWESFSEDEPEPPKPKPALKPAAKGKKSKDDQSKLQGNLMSYFARK